MLCGVVATECLKLRKRAPEQVVDQAGAVGKGFVLANRGCVKIAGTVFACKGSQAYGGLQSVRSNESMGSLLAAVCASSCTCLACRLMSSTDAAPCGTTAGSSDDTVAAIIGWPLTCRRRSAIARASDAVTAMAGIGWFVRRQRRSATSAAVTPLISAAGAAGGVIGTGIAAAAAVSVGCDVSGRASGYGFGAF